MRSPDSPRQDLRRAANAVAPALAQASTAPASEVANRPLPRQGIPDAARFPETAAAHHRAAPEPTATADGAAADTRQPVSAAESTRSPHPHVVTETVIRDLAARCRLPARVGGRFRRCAGGRVWCLSVSSRGFGARSAARRLSCLVAPLELHAAAATLAATRHRGCLVTAARALRRSVRFPKPPTRRT